MGELLTWIDPQFTVLLLGIIWVYSDTQRVRTSHKELKQDLRGDYINFAAKMDELNTRIARLEGAVLGVTPP